MNPTSLKQHVNRLAERVVHIRWCERYLTGRDDIDDYVRMQRCYDTCYNHLRKRRRLLSTIHHNVS